MNLVSYETVLENHPWVSSTENEMERLKAEEEVKIEATQEIMKKQENDLNNMNTEDLNNKQA